MLNKEEEEIDGLRFVVVQFPAVYAFKLLARLAKSIGPAMTVLTGADVSTELGTLAPQLADALRCLDPDDAERLMLELLRSTAVWVGDPLKKVELCDKARVDDVFTGRIMTMFKVLGLVLRVNFSDFARGIGKLATPAP